MILADKYLESAKKLLAQLIEYGKTHNLPCKVQTAEKLDIENSIELRRLVDQVDVVASLVPPPFHH